MTTKKPQSTVFQGDLRPEPGVVYDYTEITGSVYASGADTRTAFPKLTTVGGSVEASGADTRTAFPKLVASRMKVAPCTVSAWETGRQGMRPRHLKKFARLLRIHPFELSKIIEPDAPELPGKQAC